MEKGLVTLGKFSRTCSVSIHNLYLLDAFKFKWQVLVMAKWKVEATRGGESWRLEQRFYQMATFFHVVKNLSNWQRTNVIRLPKIKTAYSVHTGILGHVSLVTRPFVFRVWDWVRG